MVLVLCLESAGKIAAALMFFFSVLEAEEINLKVAVGCQLPALICVSSNLRDPS